MTTEQIRRGLHSIQTRSATIEKVAAEGPALVEELLPLLQDRNEGVRWSTIRILKEVGDDRAVGPLIALLEQAKNATDAAAALRSITGKDLGEDAGDWRAWVMQNESLRDAAGDYVLSDADLIQAAIRELPVELQKGANGYNAVVSLPEQREQTIWIDFSRKDPNGRAIVQLCTPCGNVDPKQYEDALKLNMTIPYGAIAVALLGDTSCFVMVDSYLRETVHPADMAESIMSLARHGDSIENSLSAEDRF